MAYFDEKQIKLIKSWHQLSVKSEDYYMSFISEWIAFNAICYNLFYEKAVLERANIDRKKSKKFLTSRTDNEQSKVNISAKVSVKEVSENDWTLQIDFPERLFLSVSKKYTEDIIYQLFAEEFANWYTENESKIQPFFNELKKSLKKEDFSNNEILSYRYYVINMQKEDSLSIEDIDRLASKNIVILCEENNLKTVIKVLYQIRNNIFHGEKIPGEINDDRIVKSALPMLRFLISELMITHNIE